MIQRCTLFLAILYSITFPATLPAAEVINLKPTFSSNRLILDYDLKGEPSERTANVDIIIELNGRRYPSTTLTLSGDFGKDIPLGKNRRIIWKHLKDVPEGLDSTFKCIVNAVPTAALAQEVERESARLTTGHSLVNRQTVSIGPSGLMWLRSGSISPKPLLYNSAKAMIQQLNNERLAGYNDWRMPTRSDFESLVFPGQEAGWWTGLGHFIADYLTANGFEDVVHGNYWTSSQPTGLIDSYYAGNTWNGILRPMQADNYYYLWPVRNSSSPLPPP